MNNRRRRIAKRRRAYELVRGAGARQFAYAKARGLGEYAALYMSRIRFRVRIASRQAVAAVDPSADSNTGKLPTRDPKSSNEGD